MTTITVVSAKHSPGATTTAVSLAIAAGPDAVVVEVDPAGGDIAARSRLPVEPGLLTMAASGRHGSSSIDVPAHCQRLASGANAVVAPTTPEHATAAISMVGDRLVPALRALMQRVAVLDGGRWDESSIATASLRGSDLVLLAVEPSVAGVEHAANRVDALRRNLGARVAIVLCGDRPYEPAEVEDALFVPVVGALPIDSRGATAAYQGPTRTAERSLLVRAANTVLDRVTALVATPLPEPTR